MAKRSRLETAFETRLHERARQREESKVGRPLGAPREEYNRAERRLMGDTNANRTVPKFKTVEEADRWLEKQERIAYRQRALMTEPQDANLWGPSEAGVWPQEWGHWQVTVNPDGTRTMMINGQVVE